jgi:hypothetical protein
LEVNDGDPPPHDHDHRPATNLGLDGYPRIPAADPLLLALRLAHGEAGRPDIARELLGPRVGQIGSETLCVSS